MRFKSIPYTLLFLFIALSNVNNCNGWSLSPETIAKMAKDLPTYWDIFNKIFFSDDKPDDVTNGPTAILLRYNFLRKGKIKQRTKFLSFPDAVNINNYITSGPFETLQDTTQKLTRKPKDDIDVEQDCEFIYYDGKNHDTPINIMDDGDLIILMSKKGDQDNNQRLIDVICDDLASGGGGGGGGGGGVTPPRPPEIQQQLYKKNLKAFNHVIAVQNTDTEKKTLAAQKALNEVGFGGFSIDAQGVAILDIEKDEFTINIQELAEEWEWGGKIMKLLNAVPRSGRSFSGDLNIQFDPTSWKIKGQYQRFAGFKTVEDKFSIYVATAKFGFNIPTKERDGGFLDKIGVTSGGSIKQEYFEKIKDLLEGKSLKQFEVDVAKPEPDDYMVCDAQNGYNC